MNISMETTTTLTCNITLINKLPYDIVLYTMQFLFGLPIHSYIVWIIVTGRGTEIASDFFTLNISVCEIFFCLRSLASTMFNTFPWLWDTIMFLSGFVFTGRFFQCLICVERYLAVVHPVTFLKYKHLRYRVACSILIWIMIALYCVLSLLIRGCLYNIFIYLYILQFLAFLSINLFCCLAVLRALKQSGPGERGREIKEENQVKRRAFHLILITTVTLLITYAPSLLLSLQYILAIQKLPELDSLSLTCFMLPGFVQPLIYIHKFGKLPFCSFVNCITNLLPYYFKSTGQKVSGG